MTTSMQAYSMGTNSASITKSGEVSGKIWLV